MQKYIISDGDLDTFEVDQDWLEGVNTRGAVSYTFHDWAKGKMLEVEYQDGTVLWYQSILGTWGFPTEFKN